MKNPLTDLGPLALALAWDRFLGEPPLRFHPVVWMGHTIEWCRRRALGRGKTVELIAGSAMALLLPLGALALTAFLLALLAPLPPLRLAAATFLLTSSFSLALLGESAQVVHTHLAGQELEEARRAVGALCSRDTQTLEGEEIVATTLESLSENSCDSFVAPLFFFALFGLPGALGYRMVNTLDACIGYHGTYEQLGKASARLDDLLNWIPARIAALSLVAAGHLQGLDVRGGLRAWREEGGKTPSPNGGATMATTAGLFGVRLAKPGVYCLDGGDGKLEPELIPRCRLLVERAAHLSLVPITILLLLRHALA